MSNDFEGFIARNRISHEKWEASGLEWSTLQKIAADYEEQRETLRDSADLFARVIQRFRLVHSVRWRVKETEHLLEKIVRKCADQQEKYKGIDEKNYFEVVTDLIGLRALHLFKDDCFEIGDDLCRKWTPFESPTAYLRQGDPEDLELKFRSHGFEVKKHPAGYRSVHYVLPTQPLRRKAYAEIQVRTIFEEGWSEIDHRVRYPNFSDDDLVSYFLTIFNRLAGNADEMGTFVQGLADSQSAIKDKLAEATKQKEDALKVMDQMLREMEATKQKDAAMNDQLIALQREVEKLRQAPTMENILHDLQPVRKWIRFGEDNDVRVLAARFHADNSPVRVLDRLQISKLASASFGEAITQVGKKDVIEANANSDLVNISQSPVERK